MQAERWKQIEELFEAAKAQPPEKRAEFLRRACPEDAELRGEAASLLNQNADTFLDSGPLPAMLSSGAKLAILNSSYVSGGAAWARCGGHTIRA